MLHHGGEDDLYSQGKKLLSAKEYGRAIAVFTAAVAADHPELALCYNLRGVCHSWLGKHEDALRDAGRAVKLRPSATLYCNRGKAYRALKRYAEARADFAEAMRREPGHKHAVAELNSLAAIDGGTDAAHTTIAASLVHQQSAIACDFWVHFDRQLVNTGPERRRRPALRKQPPQRARSRPARRWRTGASRR